MSILSFSFPFILIVILAGVWLVVFTVKKYFPAKATHWMLLIYTSVLLLAAVFVLFGIKGTEVVGNKSGDEKGEAVRIQGEIHDAIEQGKMPDIDKKFISAEKSFKLDASVLKIDSDWEGQNPYIVIERSAEIGQQVKVRIYSLTVQEVEGYALTKAINPPNFKMSGNLLLFSKPSFQEFKYAIFGEEFPINQFKYERRDGGGGYSLAEEYVIFVQIPEDLQIDEGDGVYINYLN